MFKVNITNNANSFAVNVPPDTTIRSILEEEGVNYQGRYVTLNTRPLSAAQMDNTLAELGVNGECYLSLIQKLDNAA